MADCHAEPAVLLVQPERDDREMYAEFLRYRGFVPISVSTAVEALGIAARANVIVSGILLPGSMDGIALVERLKAGPGTSQIPVIVLTACAWQSDRNRARVAGCDAFLVKPCLPDRLVHEIRHVMMTPQSRRVSASVTPGFSNGHLEWTRRRVS